MINLHPQRFLGMWLHICIGVTLQESIGILYFVHPCIHLNLKSSINRTCLLPVIHDHLCFPSPSVIYWWSHCRGWKNHIFWTVTSRILQIAWLSRSPRSVPLAHCSRIKTDTRFSQREGILREQTVSNVFISKMFKAILQRIKKIRPLSNREHKICLTASLQWSHAKIIIIIINSQDSKRRERRPRDSFEGSLWPRVQRRAANLGWGEGVQWIVPGYYI